MLLAGAYIFNILTCLQLVGTRVQNIFRNVVPYLLTCPQLMGTRLQTRLGNPSHFLGVTHKWMWIRIYPVRDSMGYHTIEFDQTDDSGWDT